MGSISQLQLDKRAEFLLDKLRSKVTVADEILRVATERKEAILGHVIAPLSIVSLSSASPVSQRIKTEGGSAQTRSPQSAKSARRRTDFPAVDRALDMFYRLNGGSPKHVQSQDHRELQPRQQQRPERQQQQEQSQENQLHASQAEFPASRSPIASTTSAPSQQQGAGTELGGRSADMSDDGAWSESQLSIRHSSDSSGKNATADRDSHCDTVVADSADSLPVIDKQALAEEERQRAAADTIARSWRRFLQRRLCREEQGRRQQLRRQQRITLLAYFQAWRSFTVSKRPVVQRLRERLSTFAEHFVWCAADTRRLRRSVGLDAAVALWRARRMECIVFGKLLHNAARMGVR